MVIIEQNFYFVQLYMRFLSALPAQQSNKCFSGGASDITPGSYAAEMLYAV